MREIKFRAWVGKMEYDITTGKFGTFFVNEGVKGDGLDERDSATLTPFNTKIPNDTPVMQYTGLKDKNGKEIYEGDIVVLKNKPSYFDAKHMEGKYEVGFNKEQLSFIGLPYNILTWSGTESVEVIGNIYENPELIK